MRLEPRVSSFYKTFSCSTSGIFTIRYMYGNDNDDDEQPHVFFITFTFSIAVVFGLVAQDEWKSATNTLDLCKTFFTNPFSDRFPFSDLYCQLAIIIIHF